MTPANSLSDPIPFFSPEMHADPHRYYHRMRAIDPVYWSERHQAWMVTGYDQVVAGLSDLRLSSERAGLFEEMAHAKELAPFFAFLGRRMILNDPPRHTRLRSLVSKAFTPHVVEAMRPHIQQIIDRFLDAAVARGTFDLIHDLAFPLPATVITEMLGVSPDDRDELKQWSDAFVVFFSKHPADVTLDEYRAALAAMNAMVDYFRATMPKIRSEGKSCLLQKMSQAEIAGDHLSDEEVFANANLLLIAGHETTTNLLGNGMYALLAHPDQLAKLRGDTTLIANAVEEFLRHDGPVQFTHRLAKEDVELGGKSIRKGQFVFLFLAAANRDPAHFPDPDCLDLGRAVHKHMAFGAGHHFCLGAPLARLEVQLAVASLLRRFPKLRLADAKPTYNANFNLRGFQSLPLEYS